MRTLFHGSRVIVEYPEIRVQRYQKDFFWGFYCTDIERQAVRWATKFGAAGIVNVYSFDDQAALSIKQFPEMTEEWLDFIIGCRNGKTHQYDIVIGAMADDQIYNFIADYIDGIITREQFWVLAKFKYPTHQICFSTKAALKCLEFRKAEELK